MNKTCFPLAPLILAATFVVGCSSESEPPKPKAEQTASAPSQSDAPRLTGTITEIMNSGSYTYALIDTGDTKVWAAGPETTLKVGDSIDQASGVPMHNFTSKTLNRTFDSIYFLTQIGSAPAGSGMPAGQTTASNSQAAPGHGTIDEAKPTTTATLEIDVSTFALPEGGSRVAEIFSKKAELAGGTVIIRGKAVKFSPQIMGRNWLHLQDGTGSTGTNDLVITTADTAQVGDTVLVTGDLIVDKDFGGGYKYDVIIENAKLAVE
ncbi:NrfJ [hydrothermal vent metagenome]|uniref:NrfJ n=1 Tax=hydrothermal vent metagenome TaxID=652676 RepID=A0A3B1B8G5_9ZZZZ